MIKRFFFFLFSISCCSALMAGILPFGAMFIELFFIFSAIWENQFYYLFGFLFLVFIILAISCSQIAIVMVYFQLCGEVGPVLSFLESKYEKSTCWMLPMDNNFFFETCPAIDRIITGGGGVSSFPADQLFTCSPTPFSTSSPSWRSPNLRPRFFTLATQA